jgi:hypothetical protein
VLTAKIREPPKTKGEIAPGRPKPKVETSERAPANPLWARLATHIQPKLVVSQPGDAREREADRAAEAVIRGDPAAVREGSANHAPIRRMCANCADEQRKPQEEVPVHAKRVSEAAGPTGADAGPLAALEGGGQALPAALRAEFEPRFGHDFGGVRMHTGARAGASAQALGARAYTWGRHVVFGPGQFDPASTGGRRLLAHELAHVVQQSGGGRPLVQRQDDDEPKKDPGEQDKPKKGPGEPDVGEKGITLDSEGKLCVDVGAGDPLCFSKEGFQKWWERTHPPGPELQTRPKNCPVGRWRPALGFCCPEGTAAEGVNCVKPESLKLPPVKIPAPQTAPPPKPQPLVFDKFVDRFTVLFKQGQPRAGQSLEDSLAGGRGELDAAIAALKKDLSTGAQLVANASMEGESGDNLNLTDRRLAAVRAEMKDVDWKLRDAMPNVANIDGCRGSWGAYSCGEKNADQKTMRADDRNVIIRLFRPTSIELTSPSPWPPKP